MLITTSITEWEKEGMHNMAKNMFNEMSFDLLDKGYTPGAPSEDAADIDREVCDESSCPSCGHQGMQYKPYTNKYTKSYVAYCVCGNCGYWFEF